jgi:hypothetical protein
VESGQLVLRVALKKAFEVGDELEKIALMMGAKMDLPIDDVLHIAEMWISEYSLGKMRLKERCQ